MIQKTSCSNCGYEFLDDPDQQRTPCPNCGDTRRTFSVMGMATISVTGHAVLTVTRHIQHYSDFQRDWESILPTVHEGEYTIEPKSLSGDAPKELITLSEQGLLKVGGRSTFPSYVAKVGIKKYPIESITEHLNTRLAQSLGLRPAMSALCVISGQVRFLSNYFLGPLDDLTHGVQILEAKLGETYVREVMEKHREREHYTFQLLEEAIIEFFSADARELLEDFVLMLLFDALVGLHDRHHGNWGIIVAPDAPPRFAPFYDNARALFWNWDDSKIETMLRNPAMLEAYVQGSLPQMRFEGLGPKSNHFQLLHSIASHHSNYRSLMIDVLSRYSRENTESLLDSEFSNLMSQQRRKAIVACLSRRHENLNQSVV